MSSRTRPFPWRARGLLAAVGVLAVVATACGSDNRSSSSSSASSSATTAAGGATTAASATTGTATTAAIPKNLTLTVADQSGAVATPFGLAKAGDGAPYKVKFADFNGGAAAIEALRAGAADLAYVGEAPVPIAADSGINDLVAVAAAANPGSSGNYYLVAKPDSPIKAVTDLKGKKIAYPPGTGRQMILAGILQSNGMSLTGGDVQGVQLAGTEVAPTFAAGAVDAAMVLGAQYFKVGEPRILADGRGHNFGMSLLITTRSVLQDEGKMAAIGDFVQRAAHAENYKAAHVDEYIDADYVAKQGITHAQGKRLLDEAGVDSYYPIDDALIGAFQQVADNLRTSGVVKNQFNAAGAVDARFNALVVAQNQRDGVTPKPLEP